MPESTSSVLESDLEAILPESKVEDGEEFVDLAAKDDASAGTETVPAKKPAAAAAPAKKPAPAADVDDDLPEDLRGKTPKELAKMYREAQSLIGRQGSELGEFRRKADLLIQASLANLAKRDAAPASEKKPDAPAEDDETEFFAKPKAAVSREIENHPIIKEIREALGKAEADKAAQAAISATEKFNTAHPDAGQIMQDPEFRKWVGASRVRSSLLKRAHERFDFDAGDEIFGTWKALKGVKPAPAGGGEDTSAAAKTLAAAAKAKREAALRDAATPTGGGAGGSKAGGSKKIYRRADVLRLMEEDNARYEALAPEIELAYREGRVR